MELKNLNNLKDEITYLEEAEELLQAIRFCFDYYELRKILKEKYGSLSMITKLDKHFNFDDSQ